MTKTSKQNAIESVLERCKEKMNEGKPGDKYEIYISENECQLSGPSDDFTYSSLYKPDRVAPPNGTLVLVWD